MKFTKLFIASAALFMFMMSACFAWAEDTRLQASALTNAGGNSLSSSGRVVSSLGQSFAARAQSENYTAGIGFLYLFDAPDDTAPSGAVTINSGVTYTNARSVTLSLSAQDNAGGSGVNRMQFSSDGVNWTQPEAYAAVKSWSLLPGDGTKTAYARFIDRKDNVSNAASDTIILDGTIPSVNITNPVHGATVFGEVSISASASDMGSQIKEVKFYIDNLFMGMDSISPYSYSWDTTLETNDDHVLKVIAYDNAGNFASTQIAAAVHNYITLGRSVAMASGYRVMLQRRNPDGTLQAEAPFIMKGVAWSPAGAGNNGSVSARRAEFPAWVDTDAGLMQAMNANAVRTYLDFGIGNTATEVLDKLYEKGIMVVMGIDNDGRGDINNALAVVEKYKTHPAILMWMIGNEWNINCYMTVNPSEREPTSAELNAAAQRTQDMASQIKAADPDHLVCTGYGDLAYPYLSATRYYVQSVCTSVDVWGINVYRGNTFGTTFSQWESISTKPMFISEFGCDSYRADAFGAWPITGSEDEQMQADFDISLWDDLFKNLSGKDASNVCVGGSVFSWNDEWWKAANGSPNAQDNGGYYTDWNQYAFPDGCGNEEYFGIVRITRAVKQAYNALKEGFAANYEPPLRLSLIAASKGSNPEGTQWNTYARFYKNGSLFYSKTGGSGGGRGINLAVINDTTGEVEDTKAFDTWGSSTAASEMISYLNGVSNGRILMFAIADEGTKKLTAQAIQTLESLGSTHIRNVGFRNSWAMIIRKGYGAYAEDSGSGPKEVSADLTID